MCTIAYAGYTNFPGGLYNKVLAMQSLPNGGNLATPGLLAWHTFTDSPVEQPGGADLVLLEEAGEVGVVLDGRAEAPRAFAAPGPPSPAERLPTGSPPPRDQGLKKEGPPARGD